MGPYESPKTLYDDPYTLMYTLVQRHATHSIVIEHSSTLQHTMIQHSQHNIQH